MSILVTGAAGFIGSHLSEALVKIGHNVIGLDNLNSFYDPKEKERNIDAVASFAKTNEGDFNFIKGDILDLGLLTNTIQSSDIEAVIHLAAAPGVRPSIKNPQHYEQTNILGTLNVLTSIAKHPVPLIFGSSSSVYGNTSDVPFKESDPATQPISPYAATKRACELLCHTFSYNHGLSILLLRFFTVYGPRQRPDLAIRRFMENIISKKEITLFGNGTSRDYTYVSDIVDGIIMALKYSIIKQGTYCETYNLGNSQPIQLKELISLIENKTSSKATLNYGELPSGDVQTTFADITLAQKILKYQPKVPIEEGLEKMYNWLIKEGMGT